MKLTIAQYPNAIAQAAQAVNHLDYRLNRTKRRVEAIENAAETITAFEADLKNDSQRKAHKAGLLLANEEYQDALEVLTSLSQEKSNALAHLEQLRNEFSVAKLEVRMAIAQKLTGLEARELVGM